MEFDKIGFIGEYFHTIDAKSRLIIPVKYRDKLGEVFVVNKGNDGCLTIYTREDFAKAVEKLNNYPNTRNARLYTRAFVSSAVEVEMDKQGRVLLPAPLREYAGLEKDVVFAGANDKIEVWDKAKWDADMAEIDIDALSEELAIFE